MPTSATRSLNNPELLRELVQNLQEAIYITSAEGEIVDANPAMLEMLGVAALEELRTRSIADFVDAELWRWKKDLLERESYVRDFELKIRRSGGEVRTVLDTAYRWKDPTSGETFYHGMLVDITARKELENELREQSVRDPLTGCFNRRYLAMFETASDELPGGWDASSSTLIISRITTMTTATRRAMRCWCGCRASSCGRRARKKR